MSVTEIVEEYARNLAVQGKRMTTENPDRLTKDELVAVTARIFDAINSMGVSQGYKYHETGVRRPDSVSKERQQELFMDFLDWYQIIQTPNGILYDEILANFPKDTYTRILCIGDGEHCHLGRKLAMKGYDVISVDPKARREFTGKISPIGGNFRAYRGNFLRKSVDLTEWADLIVGSKVPMFAEDLIGTKKPTVFNIEENSEYNMMFQGKQIQSQEELAKMLSKCEGITTRKVKDKTGQEHTTFTYIPKLKDHDERE